MQKTTRRRHDIDTLRVLVFGLLIFYHLGMAYVADWGWHVKSAYQAEALQIPMLAVSQWRMPLLFLISGAASWYLLRNLSFSAFLLKRLRQLLLPLLFGVLTIVPPQAYYEALSNGIIEPGYMAFLKDYVSLASWPEGAFTGSHIGLTWNHLWYLPYLLCYTIAVLPLAIWLRPRETKVLAMLESIRSWQLLFLPLLPLTLYGLFLFPIFGGINHFVLGDWYTHAQFFTFFLYGYLLAGSTAPWKILANLRLPLLAASVLGFTLFVLLDRVLPEGAVPGQQTLLLLATYANRWFWILCALAWAYRYLNRSFSWLPYTNEAVYPWYLLHQTIMVIAVFELGKFSLGPVLEPLLVLVSTTGGCLLLYELMIRRVPLLRPLFGLRPLEIKTAARPAKLPRSAPN